MSLSRLIAALVAAFLLARAAPAGAQTDEIAVSLAIDPCVDVDAAEAQRLFALELGTSVPGAVQSDTEDATKIDATCDGNLVVLRVRDPLTGKELTRRISLGRKGRERLLALAVMELVVASWIELETTPKPAVPAADSRAPDASKRRARTIAKRRLPRRERERTAWVTTVALGTVSTGSAGLAAGGGIRVAYDGASGFGWAADMVAVRSSEDVALGTVAVRAVTGSASAHWHTALGPVRMRAGVGARLAAVTMTGTPSDPDVATGDQLEGWAGGPFARLSATVRPVDNLTVGASIEPGYYVLPVRGTVDGVEETTIDGAWMSAHLAVGWSW